MSVSGLLFSGVLVPAVVAGLVLAAGWAPWRAELPDGRWAGGLALGVAFFAAFALLVGLPPLPFGERRLAAQEWLAWLALVGGAALVAEPHLGRRSAFALRLALAAAACLAVLPPRLRWNWNPAAMELLQPGAVLGLMLVWGSTERLARRAPGASVPAALVVSGTSLAVVLGLTGSALLGQLAGALTAALGAALVLSLWRPGATLHGPGVALWAGLSWGLALCGVFFSYTPTLDAVLVGLAPLLAWTGELAALRGRPAWLIVCARAAAVAIPAGAAVTRAVLAFEPTSYESY